MLHKWIKSLETLGAVAFGVAYWLYDLRMATGVLILFSLLFVLLAKATRLPLTKLQWGTFFAVLIFGGASLAFQDEVWIKWKTTIINTCLGSAFLISQFVGSHTLLERLAGEHLPGASFKLRRINAWAGGYFLCIAIANTVIAYTFSTTVWVNFKLFGIMLLHFVFILLSMIYLKEEIAAFSEKQKK